jgi:heme/copper-type cytochrome/quinol oxidase subunit 3
MEAAASAPHGHENVEPEPREWQPRAIWVTGRLLCGSISFFFASFVFAFFYLQALDLNHAWKIGHVTPAKGLGISIMALYVTGAVVYRLAAKRPEVDEMAAGVIAVLFTLAAVALQFFEYTQLNFGAASGGYAAVFFGWTSLYAIVALFGVFWIWIQVASLYRVRREGHRPIEIPAGEEELIRAGVEASSFYWAYFAAIGLVAWIILYYAS